MTQPTDIAEHVDAAWTTALWASAKVTDLLTGSAPDIVVPEYGTLAWAHLPSAHGQKWAAALTAAESWRRHEHGRRRLDALAEEDPKAWFQEVTVEADRHASRMCRALASTPTFAELAERRKLRPARPVTPSPEWSPVAVPGRPGWWRHHIDGEQIDLPYCENAAARSAAA